MNKTQILLTIIILLIVGYIIFPKAPAEQGISLEQLVDSIAVHDKEREKAINVIRIRYTQDSFKLANIQKYLNQLPEKTVNIHKHYDIKRNYIDTASIDEQGRFFAEWISKENN